MSTAVAEGVVFHVTLLPDDPENDARCCFRLEAELAASATSPAKLPYWVQLHCAGDSNPLASNR